MPFIDILLSVSSPLAMVCIVIYTAVGVLSLTSLVISLVPRKRRPQQQQQQPAQPPPTQSTPSPVSGTSTTTTTGPTVQESDPSTPLFSSRGRGSAGESITMMIGRGVAGAGQSSPSVLMVFHGAIAVVCGVRAAMFIYCFVEDDLRRTIDVRLARSLERFGSASFFVAMSLVLFKWMEWFHKNYVRTNRSLSLSLSLSLSHFHRHHNH